jgi:hypothetical protein
VILFVLLLDVHPHVLELAGVRFPLGALFLPNGGFFLETFVDVKILHVFAVHIVMLGLELLVFELHVFVVMFPVFDLLLDLLRLVMLVLSTLFGNVEVFLEALNLMG